MANFAKLGLNNEVIEVQLIDTINTMTPEGVEDEEVGRAFLAKIFGHQTWLRTSFNTFGGQHKSGGVPFRKNYAEVGGFYDADRDAFIPPKPFPSWVLDEETCRWIAPVPYPENEKDYNWNEDNKSWDEVIA